MKRFKEALSKVTDETEQIVEKASGTEREIMNAYLMILQDPTLIAETGNAIMNQNYNAEYAVEVGFNNVIQIFENSLNVSETSRQLYIHRNTLVYRLDKLQKSTGLDLRVFEDAITFKIALMVVKYMKYMETIDY